MSTHYSRKAGLLLVLSIALFIVYLNGNSHNKNTFSQAPSPILELKPDIKYGEDFSSSNDIFTRISSLRVDNQGFVYVLDTHTSIIKIFDQSGKYLKNFGRSGQGPGEFISPMSLEILGNGDIAVFSLGKLSFFNNNGIFINSVSTLGKLSEKFPSINDSNLIIAANMEELNKELYLCISTYDFNMNLISNVVKVQRIKSSPRTMIEPFGMQLFYTFVRYNNTIVWGVNDSFKLNISDINGNILKTFSKDFKQLLFEDKDKELYLSNNKMAPIKDRIILPNYYPAFQEICADDEGRILVRTFKKDANIDYIYEVFNIGGEYLGQIKFATPPLFWKNGYMYTVIDREDKQFILRYKVKWL